jgi:membrane protease YdiL (CAAX protease family)
MASDRTWWPIGATLLVLVVANVVWNRLATERGYVPWAVAVSALLIAIARRDGRTWSELGLGRRSLRRGVIWGLALGGIVLAGYVVGYALPATHDLFLDDRVRHMSFARVAYYAFVRVPLGTVLLEEVAFRAVVPALFAVRTSTAVTATASAVLFGCWHILPALGLDTVNPVATDTVGSLPSWVTVVGAVVAAGAVAVWFWYLRRRSDSLLAPMALHWSTNALGYLFAWAAWAGHS